MEATALNPSFFAAMSPDIQHHLIHRHCQPDTHNAFPPNPRTTTVETTGPATQPEHNSRRIAGDLAYWNHFPTVEEVETCRAVRDAEEARAELPPLPPVKVPPLNPL